ncbi:uncharacterized protein LOC128736103 [Sabethes cyaneus]|uniref:uncharacterized protein LOC128736103 n=1 Tax=Sabethes cyaneus TaxID=53552 RepID=UPI00237E8AD2|nr:uncharacterized protein LOC128736103 [Sabethes cyaneus]
MSGLDLSAKFGRTVPDGRSLDPGLFADGSPAGGEIVEIVGDSNCGKSCLILELIAKIILPVNCGGHAAGAVFVNCDNNINLVYLLNIMEKQIVNCTIPANKTIDRIEIERIRQESFSRLTMIKCCTMDEFEFSFLTLNELFAENHLNKYLLIDSVVAFYWSKCTETNLIRMDTYIKLLYRRLRRLCRDRNIAAICTRPLHFVSGNRESVTTEFDDSAEVNSLSSITRSMSSTNKINNTSIEHRIELAEVVSLTPNDDVKFNAFVTSNGKQMIKFFAIDKYGINWLN